PTLISFTATRLLTGSVCWATANYDATTGSSASVLLGDSQGGFGTHWRSPGVALAAGDFNNDGNLDLATTHNYSVRVRLGKGDGTFQSPFAVPLLSPTTPVSVGVADFNADQKMVLPRLWCNRTIPFAGADFSLNHILHAAFSTRAFSRSNPALPNI